MRYLSRKRNPAIPRWTVGCYEPINTSKRGHSDSVRTYAGDYNASNYILRSLNNRLHQIQCKEDEEVGSGSYP